MNGLLGMKQFIGTLVSIPERIQIPRKYQRTTNSRAYLNNNQI